MWIHSGELKFDNGDKYFGYHDNGIPNGQGVLTLKEGNKLIGEFKDGIISFGIIKYLKSGDK